jgi:ABC-type molybdate transport system permease subunit
MIPTCLIITKIIIEHAVLKKMYTTVLAYHGFVNHGFQISAVLHLYLVLPTTVFGFMYLWFLICVNTQKVGDAGRERESPLSSSSIPLSSSLT